MALQFTKSEIQEAIPHTDRPAWANLLQGEINLDISLKEQKTQTGLFDPGGNCRLDSHGSLYLLSSGSYKCE